ncbi:DNA-protecting protein DprA [bacterium]|nr:DNA-protecting protein DprA [bacterium]
MGIRRLLAHVGSAENVFNAGPRELAEAGVPPEVSAQIQGAVARHGESVDEELAEIARLSVRLITFLDLEYPVLLKEIHNPPPLVYARGGLEPRDTLAVAMVGSRRATEDGCLLARRLARGLAERGFTIVSGLAVGIDGACHQGALQAEGGRTLGVLGNGLALGPPAANRMLGDEVVRRGAVLSEFPMRMPASRGSFPRRNRIISGMTLGTVVIQAPEKSGALITARYAREQGREVFAVPGRPTDVLSAGCNQLIRDGAHMATSADDVINVLEDLVARWRSRSEIAVPHPLPKPAPEPKAVPTPPPQQVRQEFSLPSPPPADSLEGRILALASEPVHVDDLARTLALSPPQLAVHLLQLEMARRIQRLPGGRYVVA